MPLLILTLLAADRPATDPRGADRFNVLMIVVDDMRCELGCYGAGRIDSPAIDRLASRGTLFERAYCQQAVCNPSRASVLTGLRPSTLGLYDLRTHFRDARPNVVTLPQRFRHAGYFTRGIGKVFHNWVQPNRRGDSRSWSVPAVMHYFHHSDDVPYVGLVPNDEIAVPKASRLDVPDEAYLDGRVAELGSRAIADYAASGRDEPWFLAVGFWKPHAPFNAPSSHWRRYDGRAITDPEPIEPPTDVPDLALHDGREITRGFRDNPNRRPTPEQTRTLRHGYYAAISYVDTQVGRILDALDKSGQRDETIVVLWSDHGLHLGEQSLWGKTTNFELDVRVPLIIDAPGTPQGTRVSGLVELVDLYPTLTDWCGIDAPALDGESLVPLLRDPDGPGRDAAYSWHPRPAYVDEGEMPDAIGWSVRTDRYRLTDWRKYPNGDLIATELYDLSETDIETENIAARRPELVARLRPLLNTERERVPASWRDE